MRSPRQSPLASAPVRPVATRAALAAVPRGGPGVRVRVHKDGWSIRGKTAPLPWVWPAVGGLFGFWIAAILIEQGLCFECVGRAVGQAPFFIGAALLPSLLGYTVRVGPRGLYAKRTFAGLSLPGKGRLVTAPRLLRAANDNAWWLIDQHDGKRVLRVGGAASADAVKAALGDVAQELGAMPADWSRLPG